MQVVWHWFFFHFESLLIWSMIWFYCNEEFNYTSCFLWDRGVSNVPINICKLNRRRKHKYHILIFHIVLQQMVILHWKLLNNKSITFVVKVKLRRIYSMRQQYGIIQIFIPNVSSPKRCKPNLYTHMFTFNISAHYLGPFSSSVMRQYSNIYSAWKWQLTDHTYHHKY